jgi:hypothetical protein
VAIAHPESPPSLLASVSDGRPDSHGEIGQALGRENPVRAVRLHELVARVPPELAMPAFLASAR